METIEKKKYKINNMCVTKQPFCLSCEHWKKQVGNVFCQNCKDNSEYQKANKLS
jgi:hypothetical protein